MEQVGEKKKSLDGYQAVLKLLPHSEGERYMNLARDLAKGYHDLGLLDRAEEILQSAFNVHPALIYSEDVNMLTEIQIHLKEYERALRVLVTYCNVQFMHGMGE